MENRVGFTPNGEGILLEWKESKQETTGGIIVPDHIKKDKEMLENGITQVAAVGDRVTAFKVGDWVLLNSPGRLINIENRVYGFVKMHQIDGKFDKKPEGTPVDLNVLKENSLSNVGGLKLDKTIASAKKIELLNTGKGKMYN